MPDMYLRFQIFLGLIVKWLLMNSKVELTLCSIRVDLTHFCTEKKTSKNLSFQKFCSSATDARERLLLSLASVVRLTSPGSASQPHFLSFLILFYVPSIYCSYEILCKRRMQTTTHLGTSSVKGNLHFSFLFLNFFLCFSSREQVKDCTDSHTLSYIQVAPLYLSTDSHVHRIMEIYSESTSIVMQHCTLIRLQNL